MSDLGKADAIGEYVGEMLKHDSNHESDYLASTNIKKGTWEWSINAEYYGNETRFINSSKEPNCKMYASKDNHKIRIYIYTTKKVRKGEELLLNYGPSYWD